MSTTIGFIGQGWIGKHYADEFESRMYTVVRYSLEEPYINNKNLIQTCDVVFIAVPTPTTPEGFDASVVEKALSLVGEGKIAVIKSTLLPGTTEKLQEKFPTMYVLHSPEFLVEKTAAYDAAKPQRNLIGIPIENEVYKAKAEAILRILPEAPYTQIMHSKDAEMVKYAGNCFLYTKVIFMNVLYDLVTAQGGDWESLKKALVHDPRIGESHTQPVHASSVEDINGTPIVKRGAGGHCFIKDFEAFRTLYKNSTKDTAGLSFLTAMAQCNKEYLVATEKDLDLLRGVYGEKITIE